MKTKLSCKFLQEAPGFSVIELIIIIAMIAVVAGLLLPRTVNHKGHTREIRCVHNLHQIGLGFRLSAIDGIPYAEFQPSKKAWQYFQAAGREIGSPRVLICPVDDERIKQKSFPMDFALPSTPNSFAHPQYQNASLSYFFSPDANVDKPDTILSGDRNLSTNKTILSGIVRVETNTPVQWTDHLHRKDGAVLQADGKGRADE